MNTDLWLKLQNGSDIRGIALDGIANEPVNLTADIANSIGQAFALWLSQKLNIPLAQLRISVGRDSRISGPLLTQSVCEGLLARQAQVTDFGLASTPAMFMSTLVNEAQAKPGFHGAMMITASHLPFNRNGFKFFTDQGGLEKQDITQLLTLAATCAPMACESQASQLDFMADYATGLVEKVREGIAHPLDYQQPLRGLKILVDAGNGAGDFLLSVY